MVAQLSSVGITGIMFVEMDRRSASDPEASPTLGFAPPHPVVATKPSDFKVILGSIDDILNQMKAFDVPQISQQILATIDEIRRSFKDARITALSDKLERALLTFDTAMVEVADASQAVTALSDETRRTAAGVEVAVGRFDRLLADNRDRIDATLTHLADAVGKIDSLVGEVENANGMAGAVGRLDAAMTSADALIRDASVLVDELQRDMGTLQRQSVVVLRQMEDASRHLKRSMEMVADQPSVLLFSQPPPQRYIEAPAAEGR
jgi:phospholipid/cholesterol/gamma-HCH transport system substrate-binding protein